METRTMRTRDALGLTLAPLFLRLMLAITFLWAGLGKVMEQSTLPPEQAARLANIGGPKPTRAPVATPTTRPSDPTPKAPLQDPNKPSVPSERPTEQPKPPTDTPPAQPGQTPPVKEATDDATLKEDATRPRFPALAQVAAKDTGNRTPVTDPAPSTPPTTSIPVPTDIAPGTESTGGTSTAKATPVYTAADFPEPVEVFKGMNIALLIDSAANPKPRADGTTPMPLWPAQASGAPWPVVFAWAAACTEILAGALLILGLFTRLSALGLAGTMVVAMWLTQIGPAIQQGGATFGFLPPHATFDIAAWQPLLWQFSLLASSLALFFLGSGPAGLDAAIFGGPSDGASKPAKRKALHDD